jgi:hypothetical protein
MTRGYRGIVPIEVGVEWFDESQDMVPLNNREVRKNGSGHRPEMERSDRVWGGQLRVGKYEFERNQ